MISKSTHLPWQRFIRSASSYSFVLIIIIVLQKQQNGFLVNAKQNSSAVERSSDVNTKIVGGVPAILGEYPFYAIPATNWLCGATLIHGDFLVSAAHCGSKVWGQGLWLSTTNRKQVRVPPSTFYSTKQLIIHPNFTDSTNANDIMLIQITKFVRNVPIVALNFDRYKPKSGSVLTGIGFGRTREGGQVSDQLLKVNFFAVSAAECRKNYPGLKNDIMFCNGGYKAGGKDTCQGDSGGPILTEDRIQVGIVSFGKGCARPNIPAVNTRISPYKRWIRLTICQYSSVKPSYCAKMMKAVKTTQTTTDNTKNQKKNQQISNQNRNRNGSNSQTSDNDTNTKKNQRTTNGDRNRNDSNSQTTDSNANPQQKSRTTNGNRNRNG
jgi:trypsin